LSLRRAALAALAGLAASAVAVAVPARPTAALAASAPPSAGTSTSAAPSYLPTGTPVVGGDNAGGGTPLPRPGLYLDSLERGSTSAGTPGSSKYYTVELSKGETPWFSATMIVPPGYSNAESGEIDLKVSDLQGDFDCEWDDDTYQNTSGHTVTPLSVALHTPTVGGPNWPHDCPPNGGTFVVNVFRSGNLFPNDAMPVELGFRIEPPADAAELPPAAHEGAQLRPQRNGRPTQPLIAGYSFDNAPAVAPGTYRDTIVTGQTRYVRVHLRWGQRFTYLVTSTHVPSVDAFSLTAQTTVFNPMRGVAPQASDADYETNFGGESAQALAGTTLAPARYTNRTSDNDNVQPFAIDGDYFLALTLGFNDSDKLARIPYTLVVSVSGRSEPGPSYAARAVPLPSGSAASTIAGPTDGGGISAWAIALIAVVAVVALALIALLVRRRGAHAGAARHSGGPTTTMGPLRPGGEVPPGSPWPPPPAAPGGMGPPPWEGAE
jgi:Ca-activated chloride channel homolog